MQKARFYTKLNDSKVQCLACNHKCVIDENAFGKCGVRTNENGELFSTAYAYVPGLNLDPIEKKPLFHFQPRTLSLSVGASGCNFSCAFCQNHILSQSVKDPNFKLHQVHMPPENIVNQAIDYDCSSISYTYSEPTVWAEYTLDTIALARRHRIKSVYVSNGFMSDELLKELIPVLDAINVDLKSFNNDFYERYTGGKLEPVLNNIKKLHDNGVWVEITTLVIPGLNDSSQELRDIAGFIAGINSKIPWHISRFFPMHEMPDREPTPIETLIDAYEIGREAGLNNVYIGNVMDTERASTYCPECGEIVIRRDRYNIEILYSDDLKCPQCKTDLDIVL
jgi:pyruvate formate lyase activating enzyme